MLRISWKPSRLLSAGLRTYSSSPSKSQHDALKILFCGSDEFSIYSLRALQKLQHTRSNKIDSVDVVCRPDKRVGRGLKQIQEVPIKSVAAELDLHLHQIDTFKGWSPPTSINLVIAVSFGLLVPARILTGAKYGGLNVHPSLLPDLRGAAPIIHTLLKRRSHAGVTLQTMHPTRFDHGSVLAQTPHPGIPVPPECTPDQLLKVLGPLGAEQLCDSIEQGVFMEPERPLGDSAPESQQYDHAPKITSEDRHIDWRAWTADDVLLRDRILGRLWDFQIYASCLGGHAARRITFHGPWKRVPGLYMQGLEIPAGHAVAINDSSSQAKTVGVGTVDGEILIPSGATIEGEGKGKGLMTLRDASRSSLEEPFVIP